MIIIRNAIDQDLGWKCQDCGKRIRPDDPILAIKLGNRVSYDNRWVIVHLACLRPKLREFTQQAFDKTRQEMWNRLPKAVRKHKNLPVSV